MGAHSFEDCGYGKTAEEAFKNLYDQAAYDYGHNPYNGTISTNEDFVIKPLKEDETISEWTNRMLDDPDIQKWGPCACVKDPEVEEENGSWMWHFAGWAAC